MKTIQCDCGYENTPTTEDKCLMCGKELYVEISRRIKGEVHLDNISDAIYYVQSEINNNKTVFINDVTALDEKVRIYSSRPLERFGMKCGIIINYDPSSLKTDETFHISQNIPSEYEIIDVILTHKNVMLVYILHK